MMWQTISILLALVVLALFGYLYTAQRQKPLTEESFYMVVYEDGLLDLFGGLFLMMGGILLEINAGMVAISAPLLYALLLMGKRVVTQPRLDPATLPSAAAKQRQLSMLLVLGLVLFLGIAALLLSLRYLPGARSWLADYLVPILVLVVAGSLSVWAYRTGVKRLYLYAVFVVAAYVSHFWLMWTFPTYLSAIGLGVATVGLAVMVQFIQGHPKLSPSG
ncbi:MAG: hypothetical protein KDE19_19585 [Caldilineaceae bacterium]|nr:hypothetical protein [Caldilineaceae bacterium]